MLQSVLNCAPRLTTLTSVLNVIKLFSVGNLNVGISPKIFKTDKIEFKLVKSENSAFMQRYA